MLFLSTYINKVDKKGRVSVPAGFRSQLINEKFQGVIVYGSFINESIEACSLSRVERLSQSIDSLDPYSDARDAFATTILGGSFQLPFDSEGRIILPESLVKEIGIDQNACFVGKGATFEIWAPEKFESYSKNARSLAKEQRGNLTLNPGTVV